MGSTEKLGSWSHTSQKTNPSSEYGVRHKRRVGAALSLLAALLLECVMEVLMSVFAPLMIMRRFYERREGEGVGSNYLVMGSHLGAAITFSQYERGTVLKNVYESPAKRGSYTFKRFVYYIHFDIQHGNAFTLFDKQITAKTHKVEQIKN